MCDRVLPKGSWQLFATDVLPFGAVASVYGFNRVSRSIHRILCSFLRATCICFYGDFPTLSIEPFARLLAKSMSLVLNLLRWKRAQEGAKALDFGADFAAHGVKVGVERLRVGMFSLCDKEGRIEKICAMLEDISAIGDE